MARLPIMTKEIARKIVVTALKRVADFNANADLSQFTFQYFSDYHKSVFLSALKVAANESDKGDRRYYDLILNQDSIGSWNTVQDCCDFVYSEHAREAGVTANARLK